MVVLPGIYGVICSGYSNENIPLLNLLFALEVGVERNSISQQELEVFLEACCKFPNYKDWRKANTNFIRITDKVDKSEFIRLKRNLLRLYPKRRKLFEQVGETLSTYKDMMNKLNNYLEDDKPRLMESINLRFLCPDEEFRSKICQFVYEELLAIFDFSEEPMKLHSFIKTASWSYPVAVKASESINIVNTICSIASFYGVGLEVIRTDALNPILTDQNYQANKAIHSNMKLIQTEPSKDKNERKQTKQYKVVNNLPSVIDNKPPQGFSMKYKAGEGSHDYKTKGVDSALAIIEK